MASEKIEFRGHAGDRLAARFERPEGPHLATALFAHCFTCSKDIAAARRISQRLAGLGIGVLRFDFTGLGHSGGEFANTHFSSNVEDLVAAAGRLAAMGHPPALLIGHSLGGAAVLAAAAKIGGIKAVATLGAPLDPAHVVANFGASLDEIRTRGEARVSLAGRSFTIRRAFLEDVDKARLQPAIADLGAALLVMHAPRDQVVGIENAAAIFQAARHPKSFVTLDDADHLISRAEDAEYAAEMIAAWARRYLEILRPAPPAAVPEGITRVSEADAAGFLQDIRSGGGHHVLADEPRGFGGTDLGMSPYQFLAAGLGACTSMTIRMVARRKGWALDHVSVDVSHDKVHAEDCAGCEGKSAPRIDRFRRVIRLEGALDGEQRQALLAVADKCPVHRTLHSEVRVDTVLGDQP